MNENLDTSDAIAFVMSSGTPFTTVSMPTKGVDFRKIDIDSYFREHYGFGADVVAKSLILSAEGEYVMAVLPVSEKLSIVDVARAIGKKKGTLVAPDVATKLTGLPVGAIGPLGLKTPMPIVIDESILALEKVAVSAGNPGTQIVISPSDLVSITKGLIGQIRKR